MKRFEKINKLKEKWRKDQTPRDKIVHEVEKPMEKETWEVWRKKPAIIGGGGGWGVLS